jgi:hypothetical protein
VECVIGLRWKSLRIEKALRRILSIDKIDEWCPTGIHAAFARLPLMLHGFDDLLTIKSTRILLNMFFSVLRSMIRSRHSLQTSLAFHAFFQSVYLLIDVLYCLPRTFPSLPLSLEKPHRMRTLHSAHY